MPLPRCRVSVAGLKDQQQQGAGIIAVPKTVRL
jgi:hypothetical protein